MIFVWTISWLKANFVWPGGCPPAENVIHGYTLGVLLPPWPQSAKMWKLCLLYLHRCRLGDTCLSDSSSDDKDDLDFHPFSSILSWVTPQCFCTFAPLGADHVKGNACCFKFLLDLPTLASPASGRATARLPDLFLSRTTLFSDSLCCHSGTLSFFPLLACCLCYSFSPCVRTCGWSTAPQSITCFENFFPPWLRPLATDPLREKYWRVL